MRRDQPPNVVEFPSRAGDVEWIGSAFPAGWYAALDAAERVLKAGLATRALSNEDARGLRLRIGADRAWLDALRQADAA